MDSSKNIGQSHHDGDQLLELHINLVHLRRVRQDAIHFVGQRLDDFDQVQLRDMLLEIFSTCRCGTISLVIPVASVPRATVGPVCKAEGMIWIVGDPIAALFGPWVLLVHGAAGFSIFPGFFG
jgi:hypothetical protein